MELGTRLRLVIDEDGTDSPPSLPSATVVDRYGPPEANDYLLVRPDAQVECVRAKTGKPWVLTELLIGLQAVGQSYDQLGSGENQFVFVGFANILERPYLDGGRLDFSKIAYFARGRAWLA